MYRLRPIVFALLLHAVSSAWLTGCGDPAGTPCTTTGSGFTASTDCRHKCLSRWRLTCPSGDRIAPNICTGAFGCDPGSCPSGQVCYHDDDPFDDRSFCVAETSCGELSAEVLKEWELERARVQEAVRAERAEEEARKVKWQKENPGKVGGATEPAK